MKLIAAVLALCLTAPAVAEAQVFRGDSFGKRRTAAKVSKTRVERRPRAPAKTAAKKPRSAPPPKAKAPDKEPTVTVIIDDP